MGKIGDLFVRLGLKSDDYEKGIDNAKKETKGFGTSLEKMKAGAIAVWAAIGASVIKFGKDMINATNRVGDAWNRFTATSKASWNVFIESISNADFSNFFNKLQEATTAALILQEALDFETEVSNSVRLQKAAMAEELAALELLARNVSKPYEERKKAAEDYLAALAPLYKQEEAQAKRVMDAQFTKWFAATGIKDTKSTRADLQKFLVDYGKNAKLIEDVGEALQAKSDAEGYERLYKNAVAMGDEDAEGYKLWQDAERKYRKLKAELDAYGRTQGYSSSLFDIANVYENKRGDETTQPLVDAIIRYGQSLAAYDKETKRMQMALNQAIAQIKNNGGSESLEETAEDLKDVRTEFEKLLPVTNNLEEYLLGAEAPDIISDDWVQRQLENAENLNEGLSGVCLNLQQYADMMESAIVSSVSGSLQALTDLMVGVEGAGADQVLSAVLEPFARTMVNMGEMIIAQAIAIQAAQSVLINPAAAIAAGAALVAIGSAISSGLKKMTQNPAGGGTTASTSGSSSALQMIEQEITIHVVGEISGNNIVLSGQKTLNKWNR